MSLRSAIVLLLLGGLAAADPESDVIVMKDGTRRVGLIAEESAESVILQVVVKGAKGQTVVSGRVTIPRREIAEIRRMPDDLRAKELARAAAFENRESERQARRDKITVASVRVAGRAGFVAAGDLFEVRTTCDEDFTVEACDALQQAYEGYLHHFKLRRSTKRKLPVMILRGREEYDKYVRANYGNVIENPAFYDPRKNVIVACNFIQEEDAAQAKEVIHGYQKQIEDCHKKLVAQEKEIDERARKLRSEIRDKARELRAEIRRMRAANSAALRREVDDWEKDQLKRVHELKMAARKELADYRKKTDDVVEECRMAIRRNKKILRDQNRVMFEVLFHECFHAFARNRLFRDKEIPRWLNEGMASYYEMSVVEDGELIHGAPNGTLLEAYRTQAATRQLPDLESVLRAGGESFVVLHAKHRDHSTGAYAVSWALAHYLSARLTADQSNAYIDAVDSGADAASALEKALGQSLAELDEAVRAHVATLRSR